MLHEIFGGCSKSKPWALRILWAGKEELSGFLQPLGC